MSVKDDKVLLALLEHIKSGHGVGYNTGLARQEALYVYIDKLIEDAKKQKN